MPEREGQLDQISQAIGRLEGMVEGINTYIHENKHEVANASQKIDALGLKITQDIAAVEVRLETKIDSFKAATEARLTALEAEKFKTDGAKNLAIWLLQSPLVGWIAAALLAFAAFTKGHIK